MKNSLSFIFKGVKKLFRSIDRKTKALQLDSGVRCPSGCGACCLSPNVESSPIEMLGIVWFLKAKGLLPQSMQLAETRKGRSPCIFYQANSADGSQGECKVYAYRPSICRLFGFAGRIQKDGRIGISFCKKHHETQSSEIIEWERRYRKRGHINEKIALFSVERMKLLSACPSPKLNQLMPINEAFIMAAEYDYFEGLRPGPSLSDQKDAI